MAKGISDAGALTKRHSPACSISVCLVDLITSAKDAGVGSPGSDGAFDSLSSVPCSEEG